MGRGSRQHVHGTDLLRRALARRRGSGWENPQPLPEGAEILGCEELAERLCDADHVRVTVAGGVGGPPRVVEGEAWLGAGTRVDIAGDDGEVAIDLNEVVSAVLDGEAVVYGPAFIPDWRDHRR
jgi:hypothetical protein